MSATHARRASVRDQLLIALTFAAGAVDALSFLGLGKVFTANMTGNIVLLGVAIGSGTTAQAVRAAISLVAFGTGVLVAARLVNRAAAPAGWPIGVTVALALEAVAQAGLLTGWLVVAGHPGSVLKAVLVGISALAMGIQGGAIRRLGVPGVTTTYVTGTLVGLIDRLTSGRGASAEDLRRGLVLVAILAGAATGALLFAGTPRLAPALPLLITLAVVALAATRAPGDA
jgi:uncharacterized membrane protein YoaK (UPF0700 family)